ncbi:MAG TPA: extracellular solute-binding protein [Trueperaceae bacterium]|nr:extracellular solute-binding protein [Trueperaceae bacterium]
MTKLVRTTLFAVVLAALVAATAHAQRTVNLVGWAIGPDDPAIHRAENLEAAVDLMNAALEERGADYRVAIETDFETVSWDDYRRRILLGFESGQAPDIIISSHIDIGTWADAGYIAPLDDYIDRYEAFGDIADSLWDFVTYKGSVWGVPLNPEARPFYFNKKLLAELGWSDEEIAELPERVRSGDFTWRDVIDVSVQAVEAGVVEEGHGYWHRPVNGPDFWHTYYAFGGRLQDEETGQLVFTRDAALGMLTLYRDMVEQGVLTRDLINMPWNDWHRAVTDGRVLFNSAGTWTWAQWALEFGMGFEAVEETFGHALQPAAEPGGRPNTLSQPLAHMLFAGSENLDVAAELLSYVVSPELDVRALESAHLPVLESTRALPEFVEDEFLSQVVYMLDYTTAQPIHSGFGRYSDVFFRAISAVEAGQVDPEEGVEIVVDELRRALGDEVIIE